MAVGLAEPVVGLPDPGNAATRSGFVASLQEVYPEGWKGVAVATVATVATVDVEEDG